MRWGAIANEWLKQKHEVSILTTKHSERPNHEILDGLRIYRTGHATLLDLYYNAVKSKKRRNEFDQTDPQRKTSFLRRILEKVIDLTWRKLYWPDGSCLFLKPGKKLAKKIILENNVDVVISVGLPFTCHLIGRDIKETFKSIRWIMDIQDPFCYSTEFWVNNFSLYRHKNVKEEKKAFELADAIVLTNSMAKQKYLNYFPDASHKIDVIPPLYKEETIPQNQDLLHFQKGYVHIVYAGSFYKNVRSPKPILDFIRQILKNDPSFVKKLRFHFIGQLNLFSREIFQKYSDLSEIVKIHGPINHTAIIENLKNADFLLNIGNTTNYHLPSKSVEYLAIGKPIVNIISIQDDSVKLFIKDKLPILNLNLQEEKNQVIGFKNFIDQHAGYSVAEEVKNRQILPFRPKRIAKSYYQLMRAEANSASTFN